LDAALAEKGGDNTDGSTKKKGNKKNSTREETSTNLLQEHLGSLDAALAEKGSDNTDGSTKKKGNKKNSTREETSTDLLQQHPALHSLLQENLGSLEDALAEKGSDKTDDSTKKKGKKDKNATREEASMDLLQHPALHSLLQENLGSLEDAVAEKGVTRRMILPRKRATRRTPLVKTLPQICCNILSFILFCRRILEVWRMLSQRRVRRRMTPPRRRATRKTQLVKNHLQTCCNILPFSLC